MYSLIFVIRQSEDCPIIWLKIFHEEKLETLSITLPHVTKICFGFCIF